MEAKSSSERSYVAKRLRKAALERMAYLLCHIFPVRRRKVVLWTLEGKGGFSCSPKYIALELLRRNRECGEKWKLYWLAGGTTEGFPSEITLVKDTLWRRAFHLSTAHFWIGNTRTFLGTVKRKKTVYIMAWHGSISLKPIGLYRGEKLSGIARLVSEADSALIDVALSGSRWCTQMWRDGLMYNGFIKETGTPRCDVLVAGANTKRTELRNLYALPPESKICLYAPTFRGGSQATQRSVDAKPVTLDIEGLVCELEKRFGGTWYVFLRLHPQLLATLGSMPLGKKYSESGSALHGRIIDVSALPDMAEIMAATDCIVTDYSTVIFEGFLTGQPGFIYADDLDSYTADRGSLMFRPDEIPFPLARTNEELVANIRDFDAEAYAHKCARFKADMGMVDDGHAAERAVELMQEIALTTTRQ